MKKLTAGIFTVLLGLVTVNAADAAVASQAYVTQEVGKVGTTVTEYKTANDARVLAVEGEVDTLQTQVADANTGLIKKVSDLTTTLGEVTGGKLNIQAGAITATELANDAVVTDKILNENVTEAKLAPNSVTESKIKDGNVTAAKLATGAAVANIGYTPENRANKTGTIDATSTADQYPTAQAVYSIVNAIEQSDVMKSGVTEAIVGTVKTNANNIGAIAQSEYIQSLEDKTLTGAINDLDYRYSDLWNMVESERSETQRKAQYALDNAVAYTDAVVEAMKLKEISRVPAACSEPNKYCALTTNGSQFVWEVIERAEGETVTPATGSAYPLSALTPDTVEKPSAVPVLPVEPQ